MGSEIGLGKITRFLPDVVHSHDWQAGLTAFYLQASGSASNISIRLTADIVFRAFDDIEEVALGAIPKFFIEGLLGVISYLLNSGRIA